MNSGRRELRQAYETAGAHYRAFHERYFPVRALGGRRAEPMTPEAQLELERLKTARDAAQAAWEASGRS